MDKEKAKKATRLLRDIEDKKFQLECLKNNTSFFKINVSDGYREREFTLREYKEFWHEMMLKLIERINDHIKQMEKELEDL